MTPSFVTSDCSQETTINVNEENSRKHTESLNSIEVQIASWRHTLEAGKCVLVGDRWIPSDIFIEKYDELLENDRRRREKNRRQREYSARIRARNRLEELISTLPPWIQSKRYGRTAEITKHKGKWQIVEYGRTYCRHGDIPLQMPGDYLLDSISDLVSFLAIKLSTSLKPISPTEPESTEFTKRPLPNDPNIRTVVERQNRLRTERRKCIRHATCAQCPSATDIRVAWEFRKKRGNGVLLLGAILLDLECYVDNSILFERTPSNISPKKPSQGVIENNGSSNTEENEAAKFRIRGRRTGLRGWIRTNCPELEGHYKTLMRYKSVACKMRQALELPDPVPLSAVLDRKVDAQKLWTNGVHEQPRPKAEGNEMVALIARFAWEQSAWEHDANGHLFRHNLRYYHALQLTGGLENFCVVLERARKDVTKILHPDPLICNRRMNPDSRSKSSCRLNGLHETMVKRVENALKRRELWWRTSA